MTGEITGAFTKQNAPPTQDSRSRLAFNQLVEGSIPSPRTFLILLFSLRGAVLFAGFSYAVEIEYRFAIQFVQPQMFISGIAQILDPVSLR